MILVPISKADDLPNRRASTGVLAGAGGSAAGLMAGHAIGRRIGGSKGGAAGGAVGGTLGGALGVQAASRKNKDKAFGQGAVLSYLGGPVGAGYSGYRSAQNQTITGRDRGVSKSLIEPSGAPEFLDMPGASSLLEPVSKIGEWKSIDQRERSQARNRKGIRNSNAVAGLGAGVAGTALATTSGQRQAKNVVNGVKNSAKARALRPVSRAAAANPRGAAAVGGAALAAGALGVGGGLRARNAQHQSKINARRKAYHAKVNQS